MACVDRCFCENKTFDSILALARSGSWDLSELATKTRCGTHCGWCIAYLRRMLETSQTEFSQLYPKEELPEPVD